MPAHHVYTALTAVHISQGGEACNAVLLHGSHALYVRATQGWSRGGELKLQRRSRALLQCGDGCCHTCEMYSCVFPTASEEIVVKLLHLKQNGHKERL